MAHTPRTAGVRGLFTWKRAIVGGVLAFALLGALLGGAPLAVGTVYLLTTKKIGHLVVKLLLSVVGVVSMFVMYSPINYELVDGSLSSAVLEWQKIRLVSPFVNGFAAIFLLS